MRRLVCLAPALLLAACAYGSGEPTGAGVPTSALINTAGQQIGTVGMWETPGGISFRISASGLPRGIHAVHVHTTGRCDPPGFDSAGGHWNPAARRHGFDNPAGPHRGDLPNVTVAANGVLNETVTMPGARYMGSDGLFDANPGADGAALVIHAGADDYRTDPSGNSGGRIACSVLGPVQ